MAGCPTRNSSPHRLSSMTRPFLSLLIPNLQAQSEFKISCCLLIDSAMKTEHQQSRNEFQSYSSPSSPPRSGPIELLRLLTTRFLVIGLLQLNIHTSWSKACYCHQARSQTLTSNLKKDIATLISANRFFDVRYTTPLVQPLLLRFDLYSCACFFLYQ